MKSNYLLLLSFVYLGLTLSSCNNNSETEISYVDVSYNEIFEARQGEIYTFPDGSELVINDLINNFCPCFVYCVISGTMKLDLTWTNSSGFSQTVTFSPDPSILSIDEFDDFDIIAESNWAIEYEFECTLSSTKNPDIISAEIMIRN